MLDKTFKARMLRRFVRIQPGGGVTKMLTISTTVVVSIMALLC